jgi:hypothetical protein
VLRPGSDFPISPAVLPWPKAQKKAAPEGAAVH